MSVFNVCTSFDAFEETTSGTCKNVSLMADAVDCTSDSCGSTIVGMLDFASVIVVVVSALLFDGVGVSSLTGAGAGTLGWRMRLPLLVVMTSMSASLSVVGLSLKGVSLLLVVVFLFADLRAERVFLEGVSSLAGIMGANGSGRISSSTSCSASESSIARASNAPLEANLDLGAMLSRVLSPAGIAGLEEEERSAAASPLSLPQRRQTQLLSHL